MNRSAEFQQILAEQKLGKGEERGREKEKLLSSNTIEQEPFFSHFLSECSLLNTTLLQLSKEFTSLASKSEVFSFTTTATTTNTSHGNSSKEKLASIESALDVCGASLSLLQGKLHDRRSQSPPKESVTIFHSLFTAKASQSRENPLLEHCELVLKFLRARMGRVTERIEAYKQRRGKAKMIASSAVSNTQLRHRSSVISGSGSSHVNSYTSTSGNVSYANGQDTTAFTSNSTSPNTSTTLQAQLQLENSQMTSELFSELASTESAILHLARLQSTIQSHLELQHDLTCRLFEESEQVDGEVGRGNQYLRRAAEDSSMGRKVLVILMLSASIILLLLHFLKQ